jgi:HPt (histidine-containing phosphotransfer) domain-containing protein
MKELKITGADGQLPVDHDLYDLSEIKLISNNDDGLFGKILNIMVSMFSSEIENIRDLAKNDKWKEVAEIVHKLKTSLTHINADSLKQTIRDLEDYEGRSNETLGELADKFCNTLEEILVYLKIDLSTFNNK